MKASEQPRANSLKIPILVVAGALVLLVLAWLPGQQLPMQQRPYLDVQISYDSGNRRLAQVADDLRYRMNTHHGYRLVTENMVIPEEYLLHDVVIELNEEAGVLYLRALVDNQPIEVNGPAGAASSLSAKLFSLINSTLEQA